MDAKSYLQKINSEVNDLHPLLHALLVKMPHVQSVEHTHGPNELGADFVVHKFDPTLEQTAYVGVVAKIGQIKQADDTINRQIEECSLPRTVSGGKKKQVISEVWVVCSGTISNNAKEKIHYKHASTKVHFIDRDKLATLIDKHIPDFLVDVPPIVQAHLAKIAESLESAEKTHSALAGVSGLPEIEVKVNQVETDEEGYPQPRASANPISEIENNKIVWVEAPMGYGKSHLLRKIVRHFADANSFSETGTFPVYLSFRELLFEHDGSLETAAKDRLGEIYSSVDNQDFNVLYLIDGVDEVICEDSSMMSFFDDIFNEINTEGNAARLVVASRPLQEGYVETVRSNATSRLSIRPLSLGQILDFLRRACADLDVSTRLAEDIRKSNLFRQLPQSPIAALLLSRIIRENPRDLPSNLTELYAKAVELMLGRWDIEKELSTQIEYEVAETVCGQIARYMLDNSLSEIAEAEILGHFDSYLRERNLSVDARSLAQRVIERSDIFYVIEARRTVCFTHRSFAEFLYAKDMQKRREPLVATPRAFETYWINTYFFLTGLVKDCPEFINDLSTIKLEDDAHRWLRVVNLPKYFLAAFATQYSYVEKNLAAPYIDAAKLYFEVAERKHDSALASLSKVQLLWVFQYIIRESYSFEFLGNAIDHAIADVLNAEITQQEKAYACFFLATTCMELGRGESLRLVLDNFAISDLPVEVRIGIQGETNLIDKKQVSSVVRKHNKKFRQWVKGSPGVRKAIDELYQTPIRQLPRR